MQALKNIGSVLLGLAVMAGIALLGVILINGIAWVSYHIFDYVIWASNALLAVCILVFIPLALFRTTRIVSVYGFYISSFIFGLCVWIYGFLITLQFWGVAGIIIGLVLGFVGVVPLGIIAAAVHTEWVIVAELIFGLVLTYGTRLTAFWLAVKVDKAGAEKHSRIIDGEIVRDRASNAPQLVDQPKDTPLIAKEPIETSGHVRYEHSQGSEWYVFVDGKELGPAKFNDLVQLAARGVLPKDVQIRRSDTDKWTTAGSIPGLFSSHNDADITKELNIIPKRPLVQTAAVSRRAAKWRWMKAGALICFIISAIDQLFVTRAHGLTAESLGAMIGYTGGASIFGALVGFVAGAIKEFFSKSSPVETTVIEKAQGRIGNKFNLISMHWRGQYPLWISYWIINFAANIGASIAVVLIVATFQPKAGYNPLATFASITSTWFILVAITIWQIVGVWRSANNHIARRVLIGKKSPWAGLAKVAAFLMVINLAVTFAKSGLPQLTEATRIAFMGDPEIPEYSFRIMRNGTEVEITGGFKYGLTDEFQKLLKASRQISVVHLDSLGGRIGEAEKLYKVIRENGLTTYVPSKCASACTLAFAGGKQRFIAPGAVLGFHSPAFPGMSKADLTDAVAEQTRLFTMAGFSYSFVTRALNTPNTDLWKPTVAELLAAKAITGVSDGTQFAVSGFGVITKTSMASMLTQALPVLAALKDRLPQSYNEIVDAYYSSYVAGRTQAEMISAARAKLLPVLSSLKPLASDDVLLDLARFYADKYQAIWQKAGAAACYAFASGNGDQSDAAELPSSFVQRELEIEVRIVRTASKRGSISDAAIAPIAKKIRNLMSAEGIPVEEIDLLQTERVPPSRQREYCIASIRLFQTVSSLPQRDAATFLRKLWSDK